MDTLSLRPLVVEGVQPFVRAFGPRRQEATEVLVELVVGVSNYREEGRGFAPLVFVTDDLPAALLAIGGSEPIVVGREQGATAAARTALRSCAPLGEGRRWGVFVLLEEGGAVFGVFRPEASPLRPTSFELLRRARPLQGPAVVGLAQLRAGVVELRASGGAAHAFDFSGAPEQGMDPGSVVQTFVRAVTSAAAQDIRPQLQAFYYRLGVEILTGNHGTLVAVLARDAAVPALLADGMWLDTPVDLAEWIRRDTANATNEGARALFAYAQLIQRMTMMDGITLFGTDGTVRAYGCFLRTPASAGLPSFGAGGARRRAYDFLRSQLGAELVAALYRSQDGAADCVSVVGV